MYKIILVAKASDILKDGILHLSNAYHVALGEDSTANGIYTITMFSHLKTQVLEYIDNIPGIVSITFIYH